MNQLIEVHGCAIVDSSFLEEMTVYGYVDAHRLLFGTTRQTHLEADQTLTRGLLESYQLPLNTVGVRHRQLGDIDRQLLYFSTFRLGAEKPFSQLGELLGASANHAGVANECRRLG